MSADKKLALDAQAEQMLTIIESRLKVGQRKAAKNFLILKFKSLYEQGIISGRLYERDGIYPYNSIEQE